MKRENLFRLALVTHCHAPETLNKYISLLAKMVIIESSETKFNARAISKLIKRKFDLEFLDEEIIYALYADDDFEFDRDEKKYSLKAEGIQRLKDSEQNTKPLEYYLKVFLEEFYPHMQNKEKSRITEVIMQYIYFSFNSGKKSLSSLLTHSVHEGISEDFSATDTDKKIINEFLDWDNSDKNECIYCIVSYCLDYGMLTSKKDVESYKKVFEGVQFYLDANIIFRLVGMNNIERQEVTRHFVDKCNEVGIKLCYTNFTYLETFHTINNAVKYVKYLNNGDKPISPSDLDKLGEYDNKDFYEIYYNWCKERDNRYDDYQAYLDYLKQKVNLCIEGFTKVDLNNAEFSELKREFLSLSNGLMEYKNQRNPQRLCTIESAKTDVNNFLNVKYENAGKEVDSYSLKSFLISADRRFYDWSITVLPGVPTVFLPSEWLSIILKYTSRTDSDYNTFCKFMNLRLSYDDKQKKRTKQIIESINELTSDVDVKRKIINQVSESTLSLTDEYNEDSVEIVKKAFDKVLEQEKNESEERISNKLFEQEKSFKKQLEDLKCKSNSDVEKAKLIAKEETRKAIIKGIVNKKISKWIWIKDNIIVVDLFTGIISFVMLLIISRVSFIENAVVSFCDSSKLLKEGKIDFSLALSLAISLVLVTIATIFFNFMSSEKRRQKIIEKEEKKYTEVIE